VLDSLGEGGNPGGRGRLCSRQPAGFDLGGLRLDGEGELEKGEDEGGVSFGAGYRRDRALQSVAVLLGQRGGGAETHAAVAEPRFVPGAAGRAAVPADGGPHHPPRGWAKWSAALRVALRSPSLVRLASWGSARQRAAPGLGGSISVDLHGSHRLFLIGLSLQRPSPLGEDPQGKLEPPRDRRQFGRRSSSRPPPAGRSRT
jgi:hypothetical protein